MTTEEQLPDIKVNEYAENILGNIFEGSLEVPLNVHLLICCDNIQILRCSITDHVFEQHHVFQDSSSVFARPL